MVRDKHRREHRQQQQRNSGRTPMTPEEKRKANVDLGIAKAKERRRLALEKKQQQATKSTGFLGPPLPPVSRRPPTIPKSPKFASGPIRPREHQPASQQYQSLVQCTIEFGKGLRDDSSHASAGSKHSRSSSQRSLTVPQEPKLQTAKYGSKSKFLATERPALASSQSVLQKELRGPYQPLVGRREGITIPVTPKFQASRHRAPPKSTVQQEEELMAYNNAHPFKAKPPSLGRSSMGSRLSMDSNCKSRFSDHYRAATASSSRRAGRPSIAPSEASQSRAQSHVPVDDDDEISQPLKANPVPDSIYHFTPVSPKASAELVDSPLPELHSEATSGPVVRMG